MSIAAISRSFIAAVTPTRPVEGHESTHKAHARHEPREARGQRHDLVDAMNRALGVPADATKAQTQAVFRFAKALMHDLREVEGGNDDGEHRGRGKAWGRREWNDLPQRLTALAAAASRQPAGTTPADAEGPEMPEAGEVTEMPKPATPASIAVHMAKVPSSHLLEAFVAMQRAVGREQDDSDARSGLAALATQLATALQPGTKAELPAGSVVDLTA